MKKHLASLKAGAFFSRNVEPSLLPDELAILAERKTAKIIAVLEEFRRNDPHQSHRRDPVAEAMAEAAGTQVVLEALKAAEDPCALEDPTEKNADRHPPA